MILKQTCSQCGKVAEITSESFLSSFKRYKQTLKCGHVFLSEKSLADLAKGDFSSLDGDKQAYAFQQKGIEFIESTNYNALIADAMGLGKTIQAELALKRNWENLTPILAAVKSATIYQWALEHEQWCYKDVPAYHISESTGMIAPGFPFYIISHDLLARKGMVEKILALGIKTLVLDECHSFKDQQAKRTVALLDLVKQGSIKHKILLSGTPIKNRASEYFTALNLLAPQHFPFKSHFKTRWLVEDRIAPWRINQFQELISRWVIRREKKEVMPDLPPFSRNFINRQIDNEEMKKAYNQELDLLDLYLAGKDGPISSIRTLGILAKIRRLTAIAKTPSALEFIKEFLDNTEDEKICIGVHHQAVRDTLYYGLKEYGALKLSGEDSPEKKDQIVQAFKRPENRVLVCNILAGGVGLNLQFCSNVIVLERQWNSVDERQFEDRFHRNGQTEPVIADYFLAAGWIDSYFSEMVERKRKIFGETIGNDEPYDFSKDEGAIKELANTLVSNRLK